MLLIWFLKKLILLLTDKETDVIEEAHTVNLTDEETGAVDLAIEKADIINLTYEETDTVEEADTVNLTDEINNNKGKFGQMFPLGKSTFNLSKIFCFINS